MHFYCSSNHYMNYPFFKKCLTLNFCLCFFQQLLNLQQHFMLCVIIRWANQSLCSVKSKDSQFGVYINFKGSYLKNQKQAIFIVPSNFTCVYFMSVCVREPSAVLFCLLHPSHSLQGHWQNIAGYFFWSEFSLEIWILYPVIPTLV